MTGFYLGRLASLPLWPPWGFVSLFSGNLFAALRFCFFVTGFFILFYSFWGLSSFITVILCIIMVLYLDLRSMFLCFCDFILAFYLSIMHLFYIDIFLPHTRWDRGCWLRLASWEIPFWPFWSVSRFSVFFSGLPCFCQLSEYQFP